MNADLERRAHAIVDQALDVDPEHRTAFAAQACRDDPALHERVRALLTALAASEDFLETPALVRHADTFADTFAGGKPEMARRRPPRAEDVFPPRPSDDESMPDLPAGAPEEIGGYRIKALLGDGGMATVYRALQPNPRRVVAIKVMKLGLAGTSAVRRFAFETEILAQLRHPGIAQIFEAGLHTDATGTTLPFFAMEYVPDASPITSYAERHDLTRRERLHLLARACDAVQHGHLRGVIHRDLKPANLLVDGDGHPKVIDFGVARSAEPAPADAARGATERGATSAAHGAHTSGALIGTLEFMSPEQCGSGHAVDIRADVYALGVILYELLTGRRPFRFSKTPLPEALRRVREDAPPPPATLDRTLRGDLEAIVLRAMHPEPDQRYPSAGALATDIRRHLRHQMIEARNTGLIDQSLLFARRNRTAVVAAVLVVIAMVAATVLSTRFGVVAADEAAQREAAEIAARQLAYDANIAAAASAHETGEYRRMRAQLAAAPEEFRDWEWDLLRRLAAPAETIVQAHVRIISRFELDTAGERFVTASGSGVIRVWARGNADPVLEFTSLGSGATAAIAPDGRAVVVATRAGVVRRIAIDTGAVTWETQIAEGVADLAFAANDRLAVATADGGGTLLDLQTGARLVELAREREAISRVIVSRDRTRLLTHTTSRLFADRDPVTGETRTWGDNGQAVTALAVHPDPPLLAIGAERGLLHLQRGSDPPERLAAPRARVTSVVFDDTGERLAAGFADRTILVIELATGRTIATLHGHEDAVIGLGFVDDGRRLISASDDGTVRTWDLDRPGGITALRPPPSRTLVARLAPHGRLVAAAGSDGSIHVWDPLAGTPVRRLRGHVGAVLDVAWSPDGRYLYSGGFRSGLVVHRADTGAAVFERGLSQIACNRIAVSADGTRVAASMGRTSIELYESDGWTVVSTFALPGEFVSRMTFSPDGTLLATVHSSGRLRLWDVGDGTILAEVPAHPYNATAVVFDPGGEQIFTGGRDQAVRGWNVAALRAGGTEPARSFEAHGQSISDLTMLPGGTRLVGSSRFGDVLVWDLEAGVLLASLAVGEEALTSASVDDAAVLFAAASADGTVRVLDTMSRTDRQADAVRAAARRTEARRIVAEAIQSTGSVAAAADALAASPPADEDLAHAVAIELLRGPTVGPSDPPPDAPPAPPSD